MKSTVVRSENLEEMNTRESPKVPVLLGGAALTRSYVENDLAGDLPGRCITRETPGLKMDTIMSAKRARRPEEQPGSH